MQNTRTTGKKRKTYVVPFGVYSTESDRTGPEHELLLGRDGERAYLIDSLTSKGRQGSFLITGRRGMGKSSFVEHCLHEYQDAVFSRFMRIGGLRTATSIISLVLITVLIIASFTVFTNLLEVAAPTITESILKIFVFFLAIFTFLCGFLIVAYRNVSMAMQLLGFRLHRITSIVIVTISIFAIFYISWFKSPSLGLSYILAYIAILATSGLIGIDKRESPIFGLAKVYLVIVTLLFSGFIISILDIDFVNKYLSFPLIDALEKIFNFIARNFTAYYLFGNENSYTSGFIERDDYTYLQDLVKGNRSLMEMSRVLNNYIFATVILPAVLFYKGLSIIIIRGSFYFRKIYSKSGFLYSGNVHNKTFVKIGITYVILGVISFPVSLAPYFYLNCGFVEIVKYNLSTFVSLFISIVLIKIVSHVFIRRLYGKIKNRNSVNEVDRPCFIVPPVEAIFIAKAILVVSVMVYTLYPIVGVFQNEGEIYIDMCQGEYPYVSYINENSADKDASLCLKSYVVKNLLSVYRQDYTYEKNMFSLEPFYTLFPASSDEEIFWILQLLVLFALIVFIEYEFINKPFVRERDTSVINNGEPTAGSMQHDKGYFWRLCHARDVDEKINGISRARSIDLFRKLEKATLPYQYCRLWLPTIIVRVNLGFESLNHKGVVQSMLHGLAEQYKYNVTSFWTPYYLVSRFVAIIVILMFVKGLGNNLYEFPMPINFPYNDVYIDNDHENYEWQVRNKYIADEGDYCGLMKELVLMSTEYRHEERRLRKAKNTDSLTNEEQFINEGNIEKKNNYLKPMDFVKNRVCSKFPNIVNGILPFIYMEIFDFRSPIRLMGSYQPIPMVEDEVIEINSEESNLEIASAGNTKHLISYIFHYNTGLPKIYIPENNGDSEKAFITYAPSFTFRIYHLVSFFILFSVGSFLWKKMRLSIYKINEESIHQLYDSLNKSYTEKRAKEYPGPARWIRALYTEEVTSEMSRPELDPRSVELAFIDLLRQLQGLEGSKVSLVQGLIVPSPEITFVFDELDKITGIPGVESSEGVLEDEMRVLDEERRRAVALHRLLSDMKRLITGSPARYIFVGNRLLHDEWIADEGRREPLLTSIFENEIYLKSLFVDVNDRDAVDVGLRGRAEEYLTYSLRRSKEIYRQEFYASKATLFNFTWNFSRPNQFVTESVGFEQRIDRDEFDVIDWTLPHWDKNGSFVFEDYKKKYGIDAEWAASLFSQYVDFLSYRSVGNPKKMKELLGSHIRPLERITQTRLFDEKKSPRLYDSRSRHYIDADDVIHLDPSELYRIQLLSYIFDTFLQDFEDKVVRRDDKVAVNLIYLIDFLFKFHRRGFSWHNLERVEELIHIYRAPDLRDLMKDLVETGASRFLVKLLNGLFSYRFRSILTIEVKNLSRQSPSDMAAFNFTLDESQSLKAKYRDDLKRSKDHGIDVLVALAELHEYDLELEVAREYYRKAIDAVDEILYRHVGDRVLVADGVSTLQRPLLGSSKGKKTSVTEGGEIDQQDKKNQSLLMASLLGSYPGQSSVPPYTAVMELDEDGSRQALGYSPWGIRRVRIMLQIAMTFELGNDYERAHVHYHNAWNYSRALISVFAREHNEAEINTYSILKHLNILYQGLYAEAWVAEKLEGGIDTSVYMVDESLGWLRSKLPFGRRSDGEANTDGRNEATDREKHSNMALIFAELHNKAGDIFFFKGNQPYNLTGEENLHAKVEIKKEWRLGYMRRTAYHYVVSLHEIRRHIKYRRNIDGKKMSGSDSKQRESTLMPFMWPSFIFQSVHSGLADFAETKLAEISFDDVVKNLKQEKYVADFGGLACVGDQMDPDLDLDLENNNFRQNIFGYSNVKDVVDNIYHELCLWFDDYTDDTEQIQSEDIKVYKKILKSWLGVWDTSSDTSKYTMIIELDGQCSAEYGKSRSMTLRKIYLCMILKMCSAKYAAKAGSMDSAAHEFMLVSENCVSYCNWAFNLVDTGMIEGVAQLVLVEEFIVSLCSICTYALTEYDKYTERMETKSSLERTYLVGRRVGVDATHCLVSTQGILDRIIHNPLVEIRNKYDSFRSTIRTNDPIIDALDLDQRLEVIFVSWVGGSKYAKNIDHYDMYNGDDWQCLVKECLCKVDNKVGSLEKSYEGMHPTSVNIAKKIREHDKRMGRKKWKNITRSRLLYFINRHQFPALVNLKMLKVLVENDMRSALSLRNDSSYILCDAHKKLVTSRVTESFKLLEMLIAEERLFDAPLHFTHSMSGEAAWLSSKVANILKCELLNQNIEISSVSYSKYAFDKMVLSQQSISMGREYYKQISKLYYMYDDFNDRDIHCARAWEMAVCDAFGYIRDDLKRMVAQC